MTRNAIGIGSNRRGGGGEVSPTNIRNNSHRATHRENWGVNEMNVDGSAKKITRVELHLSHQYSESVKKDTKWNEIRWIRWNKSRYYVSRSTTTSATMKWSVQKKWMSFIFSKRYVCVFVCDFLLFLFSLRISTNNENRIKCNFNSMGSFLQLCVCVKFGSQLFDWFYAFALLTIARESS